MTKHFDAKSLYRNHLSEWQELWDDDKGLYSNVRSILDRLVILPYPEQLILAAVYILIPTRMAKCLPILFDYGESGSGKTNCAQLANVLHGYDKLFSIRDTSVAIRNALEDMRYYTPDDKSVEKEGVILCWDNINANILRQDPGLYQMLLLGYNEKTGWCRIGTRGEGNREFNIFCPKVISSVDALHCQPDFKELQRRLWIIKHKTWQTFSPIEQKRALKDNADFWGIKIQFEGYSWGGIEEKYYDFWQIENCTDYARHRAFLTSISGKKTLSIPDALQGSAWDVCVDWLCAAMVLGAFTGLQDAIDYLGNYYAWLNAELETSSGELVLYLQEFIGTEIGELLKINQDLVAQGLPKRYREIIDPGKLKRFIEVKFRAGYICENFTLPRLKEAMEFLGWKLTTKGWIRKNAE